MNKCTHTQMYIYIHIYIYICIYIYTYSLLKQYFNKGVLFFYYITAEYIYF